jgi:hypothetical protein
MRGPARVTFKPAPALSFFTAEPAKGGARPSLSIKALRRFSLLTLRDPVLRPRELFAEEL